MSFPRDEDRRSFWDAVYKLPPDSRQAAEDWVSRHLRGRPQIGEILELGCGLGHLSELLHNDGHTVVATDISPEALARLSDRVPGIAVLSVDLGAPLPFATGRFGAVIADLCLHYFDSETTLRIIAEIRRVVSPTGILLARVNSDRDVAFGAGSGRPVEDGFYIRDGHYKRYFDESMVRSFLSDWTIRYLDRQISGRFGKPKNLWEIAATPGPARHSADQ
jgi:SAM-dependent methyltransferase